MSGFITLKYMGKVLSKKDIIFENINSKSDMPVDIVIEKNNSSSDC